MNTIEYLREKMIAAASYSATYGRQEALEFLERGKWLEAKGIAVPINIAELWKVTK